MSGSPANTRPLRASGAIGVDPVDREWVWPVAIGALVGLLFVSVGVTYFNRSVGSHADRSRDERAQASADAKKSPLSMPESRLGRGELSTPTIAWISHSDWRELQAERSPTRQPAVQQEVDPVEDAPPRPDPTPPSPQNPPGPQASPSPPSPQETQAANAARLNPASEAQLPQPSPPETEASAPEPSGLPARDAEGPLLEGMLARISSAPDTPLPHQRQPESPRVAPQPSAPPPTRDTPQPDASPAPERSAESRPTSAPQAEQSVTPTDTEDEPVEVQPGRVLTGPGVEIVTARPELSVPARYMTIGVARNPVAIVTFDHEGEVTDVTLQNRTGLENIDAPIRASLYKWQARGERVEAMKEGQTFQKQFKILLFKRD